MEIIIDATNAAVGRIASYAAKQVLLGKKVAIVNCDDAVITGKPQVVLEVYKIKLERGGFAQKGPYFPRSPERIVKRTVRGMLPWKRARGKSALKLVKCFNELPKEFTESEKITFPKAKKPYIALKMLSELL